MPTLDQEREVEGGKGVGSEVGPEKGRRKSLALTFIFVSHYLNIF